MSSRGCDEIGTGIRANGDGLLRDVDAEEFGALMRGVKAHVYESFGRNLSEADLDDVVQEAWAVALASAERGEEIRHLGAFLRRVAWREARAIVRRRQRSNVSIESLNGGAEDVLASHREAPPEDRTASRARLARAAEALEQLSPGERAAYRARFVEELRSSEACRRLGISRSLYFERLQRASEYVRSAVWEGSSRFDELQRALLNAYVEGRVTRMSRRRAERLIASDPDAAMVVRELRRSHEATAAALPTFASDRIAELGILEKLGALGGRVKDAAMSAIGRGDADVPTSGLMAGGGTRGAGSAAAGGLAGALGLGGGAAQLAAVCGGTAATIACVAAITPGVDLPGGGDREDEEHPAPAHEAAQNAAEPVEPLPAAEILPAQVGHEVPPAPAPTAPASGEEAQSAGEAPAPAPSEPVPAEETAESDFSFGGDSGTTATAPAPSAPATSSSSGGGGSGSGGGGGGGSDGGDFAFGQ